MRSHGEPQSGQQPNSDVPDLIQVSASSGGIVAKWAPLYPRLAIFQTERRLRVASPDGSLIATASKK